MESIHSLTEAIKDEMFSSFDPCSFLLPSAYDTAWVAMIPDPEHPHRPLFHECVEWILQNQREEGFWGEPAHSPTLHSLPATLACLAALKRWNVGSVNIDRGLAFIQANTEKQLQELNGCYPRWLAIVLPAMVELAESEALDVLPNGKGEAMANVFIERQRILEMEIRHGSRAYDAPLLSYLEALPSASISRSEILENQRRDGSFGSPSATAYAFMVTGDMECRLYLESLVQKCKNGAVPPVYPIDEEFVKLCLVDRLDRLGLAEHFSVEIERILWGVYRNWRKQEEEAIAMSISPQQIFKDSLAFRLMRVNGYRVSPKRFCCYLQHPGTLNYMEENSEYFLSAMLNVHRATHLTFKDESELEDARTISRKFLEKGLDMICAKEGASISKFKKEVEHELKLTWLARLDHLEHRASIEGDKTEYLWHEKASLLRLSFFNNPSLLQLAQENYAYRQSIFINEIKELTRWARDLGLCDMGFGREKTSYCYFSVAATAYSPSFSSARMAAAKSAIIITVADDFFDMEGSLDELNQLTRAVLRWDGEGLCDHGKVIFNALENFTSEIASQIMEKQGYDATDDLRHMWHGTFSAWLKEAEWSRKKEAPSTSEYLETARISIAAHMVVLPALYSASPWLPKCLMRDAQLAVVTRLLMLITRLLNDIQSYQKELEDGKLNMVHLYMKENPKTNIEESINYIRELIDAKKKEFLELVLVADDLSHLPSEFKQLHLGCLKVFQMFFNSSNGFDSPTAMVANINNTIYNPLVAAPSEFIHTSQQGKGSLLQKHQKPAIEQSKTAVTAVKTQVARNFRRQGAKIPIVSQMKLMDRDYSSKRSQFKSWCYRAIKKEEELGHVPCATLISRRNQLRSYGSLYKPYNMAKPQQLVWL